jgi:DNA primase catalytic core
MSPSKLKGRPTLAVDGFLEELEKDELKKRTDLVALFESFGVSLTKKGSSYMGLCPFHKDTNPSLSVDPVKGLYHCFGCGESGDAIELVKKLKSVSFREAVSYLKAEASPPVRMLHVSSRPLSEAVISVPAASPVPTSNIEDAESVAPTPFIFDTVTSRYGQNLAESEAARSYLEGRGLAQAEALKRYHVGYSDGTLSDILSDADREALVSLGLLAADGHEHFARCIVVPLYDADTHVVGFYGRRVDPDAQPAHLYLKGPHKGLVNREAAKVYRDCLVLTEAVLDALSLETLGIHNVIPCYGTNGFTAEHQALLVGERVQKIVIAFDADEAGRAGAATVSSRLTSLGLTVATIEPDKGKDWNEWLVSGGTADAFQVLLAAAKDVQAAQTAETPTTPAATTPPKPDALTMTKDAGRYLFTRAGVSMPVRYRLTGVRETFSASLRVSMRAELIGTTEGEDTRRAYVDTVDLYSARSRALYAQAASSIGLETPHVERDLLAMLDALEAERDARFCDTDPGPHIITDEERQAGLELLSSPDLISRIEADLGTVGYVGESVNKLLLYLAATSRKMPDPISVIVSSQSASGKSYLIDTVKALMPEEDVVSMTSLSDQALNYMSEDGLQHKFLVMGEAVHSPSVEHQIREMLSAKELSRLVAVKDEKTGKLSSRLVRKPVLVSLAMSTTTTDVNPENASRFFVVSTDESESQTKEVQRVQRSKYTLERIAVREDEKPAIIARHRAAQRLLRPLAIVNPYAQLLGFPARMMRTRRDNERFLDLIASVAFLRQYQKAMKTDDRGREYVLCDLTDYEIAHRIMSAILPLTLSNFPRAASDLYASFRALVKLQAEAEGLLPVEVVISQRELREATGLSQLIVKRGVRTLCDYEYLVEVGSFQRGSRRGYRLAEDQELSLVDLSSIPTPTELARSIKAAGLDIQNV